MKQLSFLVFFLALVSGSAIAATQAQEHAHSAHSSNGPEASTSRPSGGADDGFDAFDANKDGELSRTEIAKHPMAGHASMVDANRNGNLDRAEFKALQKMQAEKMTVQEGLPTPLIDE